ncbi:MAG: DUF1638 domain-containing protein [Planctomycetota bacterium]
MSEPLTLKIVACGVFEDELRALAAESDNTLEVELLDAGLHSAPDELRLRAQEVIGSCQDGTYDAVCFAYGLCGRGTAGLIARDVRLVLPRAHDCISLFLGSPEAYREQFRRRPGTFYFTTGWYKKEAHPERAKIAATRRFDPSMHPHFEDFRRKYGDQNARFIVNFMESWRRNYQRAAFIDHGFAEPEHEEATRAVAEAAGWEYERVEGSLRLLRQMAEGQWDAASFLVVEPGQKVVPTNDERIFAAAPVSAEGEPSADVAGEVETGTFLYGERTTEPGEQADLGLGIDAGGTYTDSVLYDFSDARVVSKAKAVTTHHHLVDGIAESLGRLDRSLFQRVSYVCLSTTLATNAIVEGRGQPVGLLLMPYHEKSKQRIRTPLCRSLSARMNIQGESQRPVDRDKVVEAARRMVRDGAASFAVSGYGAVRNPRHELQVRGILRDEFDLPIVCGHELSGRLNFVARAHTAVLNARLIPLIEDLLEAVEQVLQDVGVSGPMFVVRGDGSVMRSEAARMRAVETVLSGPAASAAGGRLLTGRADALVVDMGGTTTDVAALRDGRPRLSREGARVGSWRTSVSAADIQTTGLGGDSAVRPDADGLEIGPERVVPISYTAERWPHVREELRELSERVERRELTPELLDFFVLAGRPQGLVLQGQEAQIVELLSEQPRSRCFLSVECGCLAPRLLRVRRLEEIGLVRRSGVTPTDALHVLGDYCRYDAEAARLGLRILGGFIGEGEGAAARRIVEEVEKRLALALMRRELTDEGEEGERRFQDARELLESAIADNGRTDFELAWRQLRPVVGIGAPVAAFLPGACRRLGGEPLIPGHADVANAIGAVTSRVLVRELVRVRPGEFGGYVVFAPDDRCEYASLQEAERAAREHAVELVRRRARGFGTGESQVQVSVDRRVGRMRDGSRQLLEVEVCGTLEGSPELTCQSR